MPAPYGKYFYVIWSDQFYDHPEVIGNGRWGHSKGMLAWKSARTAKPI
jgi:hypothetical protein